MAGKSARLRLLAVTLVLLISVGLIATMFGHEWIFGRPIRNVLIITMDTTRADHLGCYGYGRNTSPNIDRLAREGTLFSKAISQAAVTNTSHASIFTGLNPYHHGVRFLLDKRLAVLDDRFETLAEVFGSAGAETGGFVSAVPASSEFGLDQGFDVFDESFERDGVNNQRQADETADLAIRWLRQANEPFFCWVHFFDPHDPKLRPPQEILERFRPSDTEDIDEVLRAIYDAEIYYMDMNLQRVIDALDEKDVRDRTIIALTADHGQGLGDHDWWPHGIIYQEQVHVPLLLIKPGGPKGKRVDDLVRTIDIAPTLLSWAGIDTGKWPPMDGQSLSELVDEPTAEGPAFAYCDSTNMQTYTTKGVQTPKTDKYYSIMDNRWKLIYHQLRPHQSELFDLANDPNEAENVFSVRTDIRDRLASELMSRNPMIDEIAGAEDISPDLIEKLKSLGYTR